VVLGKRRFSLRHLDSCDPERPDVGLGVVARLSNSTESKRGRRRTGQDRGRDARKKKKTTTRSTHTSGAILRARNGEERVRNDRESRKGKELTRMASQQRYVFSTCCCSTEQRLRNRLQGTRLFSSAFLSFSSGWKARILHSPSFTLPPALSNTFAALISLWILPSECRYSSPKSSSRQTMAMCVSEKTPGLS